MTRQFTTPRLLLRELEERDCSPEYEEWLSDHEVNRFLETRFSSHDRASIRSFIARVRSDPDEFLFGIFLRSDGRHIGNIKVGPIRRVHGLADVSLLIGARDCWGRGYASEAIAALSRYAFAHLAISKLSASMYSQNQASRLAFIKAGYRDEGLRRGHYELDGQRCDLYELGLLPADIEVKS